MNAAGTQGRQDTVPRESVQVSLSPGVSGGLDSAPQKQS